MEKKWQIVALSRPEGLRPRRFLCLGRDAFLAAVGGGGVFLPSPRGGLRREGEGETLVLCAPPGLRTYLVPLGDFVKRRVRPGVQEGERPRGVPLEFERPRDPRPPPFGCLPPRPLPFPAPLRSKGC